MTDQLNVSDLNYENIRANLKEWMRTRPDFTDYDFEGSGLSFLLDVLAYNTHYNAVLANFMSNEMFLDTALKRSSVLSHAKTVGYKPRGKVSARAKLDLTIHTLQGADVQEFIIKAGTAFNTTVNNEYYQFVTMRDVSALKITAGPNTGKFIFNDIEVVEGVVNRYAWKVYSNDYKAKYEIPNQDVDVSTISMLIYPTEFSSDGVVWQHSSSAFNVNDATKVFFTQETFAQKTEIYFGNGEVGAQPALGSIITIEYLTSAGGAANTAGTFFPASSIKHNGQTTTVAGTFTLTTASAAVQGFDGETVDEIRYNASNHFMTQNRAVTALDYESIIRENFFNIKHIRVWGGEEAAQRQYGVVFVSIVPNNGDFITEAEKQNITDIISKKSLMGIKLKFADHEYLNIEVMTDVLNDSSKVSSSDDVASYISQSLLNYSNTVLQNFGSFFRYSKVSNVIDSAHKSINSNTLIVRLYKTISPDIGLSKSYSFNFLNPIKNANYTILSTTFTEPRSTHKVQLTNIGTKLVMGYFNVNNVFVVEAEVGEVDLTKGLVQASALTITSYDDVEFRLYVSPEKNDIVSSENNVLRIRSDDIKIKIRRDI